MSQGLSRRDLIKASAAAGVAAWTAPVLLASSAGAQTTTSCAGVKIPSCSSVNSGTVALCSDFTTDNPANFTTCVTPACDQYRPSFGFFFKICGPVTTNLRAVAVKWSGNAKTCTNTGSASIDWNAAGCYTIDKGAAGFGAGAYTSASEASWSGCGTGDPTSGNLVEMGAVGGTYANPAAGINAPAAGAGNRWVFFSAPGNVNEVGLAICFTFGSVPPTCAAGSCTAA